MRVAVVQLTVDDDKAANRDRLVASVAEAAGRGAELVVAPEASMHGFGKPDLPLAPVAEPLDGPFVEALTRAASAHQVTVVAGMFEQVPGDDGHPFNTVVAVGPDGTLLGGYHKQHLFDALGWMDSDRFQAGAPGERLVFRCGDVTVGVMTCYDLRFPELARALADDGATLLAVPSAWVSGPLKEDQWTTLVRARAIENVLYVAAPDQGPPTYVGNAMVVDPFGVVVARGGETDGLLIADVAPARVASCRKRIPSLQHRRWDVVPRSDS